MLKRKYCLLVNPRSDAGRTGRFIEKNRELINQILGEVEIYSIDPEESISEVARRKSEEFEIIVACGGDGTASNTVKGLTGSDAVFGVLPLGSGNDFARMLGLGNSFEENLQHLQKGITQKLDVVKVNKETFINTLGLGFDGLTNYLATKSRLSKGDLRYILAGLKATFLARRFEITFSSEHHQLTRKTWVAIAANGKWEGGRYLVSPFSENTDGILEILISKNISLLRLSIEFIKLSMGFSLSENIFERFQFKKCVLNTSGSVFVHADGEVLPKESVFKVEVMPGCLSVIAAAL